jgi:hypothetical protein
MALTFPAAPTDGQKFTAGSKEWAWSAAVGAWMLQAAAATPPPLDPNLPVGTPAYIPVVSTVAALATLPATIQESLVIADNNVYRRQPDGTWKVVGLTGIGGWADITAVTGNPTKHEFTDADGVDWTAYEWLGMRNSTRGAAPEKGSVTGSVTVTDGLVRALIVGQGGNSHSMPGFGSGGNVVSGVSLFAAGAQSVVIPYDFSATSGEGAPVRLGPLSARGGSGFSTLGAGAMADFQSVSFDACLPVMSDITGVMRPYGGGAIRTDRDLAPGQSWTGPDYVGVDGPPTGTAYHRTDHIGGGGFTDFSGGAIICVPRANAKA